MPLSRRQFLAATAGATYAAIGCSGGSDGDRQAARDDSLPWVKDPYPFVRHPTNLETRLEDLTGFLTPNELFFVRNQPFCSFLSRAVQARTRLGRCRMQTSLSCA